MKELEEKIIKEGKLISENILNVGSFLNQQVDTILLKKMVYEVKRLFNNEIPTKVLTIESSGIPFACAIAMEYNIPLVIAKKARTTNLFGELVNSKVYSFTHQEMNDIYVVKEYFNKDDKVLIADDFLANGEALLGLVDIVNKCDAKLVGCVVQIEKEFQNGGNRLRNKGYRVEALASIKEITTNLIKFN